MKNSISWCLTTRNRCKARWSRGEEDITLPLLTNCISSITALQKPGEDWDICIGDFSSTDVPDVEQHLKQFVTEAPGEITIKIKNINDKFNRGLGLNTAVELASSDNIFFIDADMCVLDRTLIDKGLQYITTDKVWFPVCCSFIDQEHTRAWRRTTGFGNVVISKQMFLKKPGGWMSKYSWGDEDNDFYKFFRTNATRTSIDTLVHQWHPTDTPISRMIENSRGWKQI